MRTHVWLQWGVALVCASGLAGCDKLQLGQTTRTSQALPGPEQLQKISYLPSGVVGKEGRKVYDHFELAKSCGDFELAMRWNRPPDIKAGPFHQKMLYLTTDIPADLPQDAEVFLVATIEQGGALPSGSTGWSLRMKDGSKVQAIESADFWAKQAQAAQDAGYGKPTAVVHPEKPGRAFCGQAIYQGRIGRATGTGAEGAPVPLFSVLFAMDRNK